MQGLMGSLAKKIFFVAYQLNKVVFVEFLSQTNDNADCVPVYDRFKFVDDLAILEVINLNH